MVWLFYISKGFLGTKIKVELDIIKNKKHIQKKYQEIESKKKIPDAEIIQSFPDKIFVPKNVSGALGSRSFNSILAKLSKKAKEKISPS
jgi:hypothetical protein